MTTEQHEPEPRVAQRVIVRGRVQGVFFRDQTQRQATVRGVGGWVRNRPDGSVEAHVEGSPEAVAALVRWAREGPRHADVDELRVSEVEPQGCEGFEIR